MRCSANELPNVGELTSHRSRSGHGGADQMCSSSGALSPLEVTVARTGTSLASGQLIGIHTQAHGASSLAPVETSALEDNIQALDFRMLLDDTRAGNDHGDNVRSDLRLRASSENDLGGRTQVLDTAVGARANEHLVDGDVFHAGIRCQTHVLQGAFRGRLRDWIGERRRVWDATGDGDDVLRRGTPGDGGNDFSGVDADFAVKLGGFVGLERLPVRNGGLPCLSLGCQWTVLQVFEGHLVRGHHACTGPSLDAHVAHAHAGLHAEPTEDGAGVLDDRSCSSCSADYANDVENDILGSDTLSQLAVDGDAHVLGFLLQQRLRRKNMLNLRSTDSEGEGTERAVGYEKSQNQQNRRLGRHTDWKCASLRKRKWYPVTRLIPSTSIKPDMQDKGTYSKALLGADNMHYALTPILHSEVGDAKLLYVLF